MADISTVTMPNGTVYNLKDAALRAALNEIPNVFLNSTQAQDISKAGDVLFELVTKSEE